MKVLTRSSSSLSSCVKWWCAVGLGGRRDDEWRCVMDEVGGKGGEVEGNREGKPPPPPAAGVEKRERSRWWELLEEEGGEGRVEESEGMERRGSPLSSSCSLSFLLPLRRSGGRRGGEDLGEGERPDMRGRWAECARLRRGVGVESSRCRWRWEEEEEPLVVEEGDGEEGVRVWWDVGGGGGEMAALARRWSEALSMVCACQASGWVWKKWKRLRGALGLMRELFIQPTGSSRGGGRAGRRSGGRRQRGGRSRRRRVSARSVRM